MRCEASPKALALNPRFELGVTRILMVLAAGGTSKLPEQFGKIVSQNATELQHIVVATHQLPGQDRECGYDQGDRCSQS